MFKQIIVLCGLLACAAAKPGLLGAHLAYSAAPLLAAPAVLPAPVITATSSQVVARTFNGIAHAPIIAPVAPVAPLARFAAPIAAPLAAPIHAPIAAPLVARYAHAPFTVAPVPARYAAAAPLHAAYHAHHPFAARLVASPYVAHAAPYVAHAAPYVAHAAPFAAAYASPYRYAGNYVL